MPKQGRPGFTIVELLIVIVVIAILAAISIAAFTGVQNRANDSAVQSDINNFAKKIMLYYAEFGSYPAGNYQSLPVGIEDNISLARNSYRTNTSNFYYCTGTVSGSSVFAVGGSSTSGNSYYYSSLNGGMSNLASWSGGMVGICTSMLPGVEAGYTRTYGYDSASQSWHAWTF